jgi:hypothetical protein
LSIASLFARRAGLHHGDPLIGGYRDTRLRRDDRGHVRAGLELGDDTVENSGEGRVLDRRIRRVDDDQQRAR